MSRRDDMGGIEPVTIDGKGHRFLIIEAPYYDDVAAALIEGAIAEFDAVASRIGCESHTSVPDPGGSSTRQLPQGSGLCGTTLMIVASSWRVTSPMSICAMVSESMTSMM